MKELEMHDETKPAPLPLDPTSLLTLQNISDLFLRFKKKVNTTSFYVMCTLEFKFQRAHDVK